MTDTDRSALAETTLGWLQGTDEGDIVVFRGVPYAAPPVGERRWRATEPHSGWSGVRSATAHGPICPQPVDLPWNRVLGTKGRSYDAVDEDCLTLTISTPSTTGSRPVVVYIHGGGNIAGAGSWDTFSLASFARSSDFVGVGVNYRLGALGYLLVDEGGTARGNWWLDDVLTALRWVQGNISAFGGDPTSVTVIGHSGGAASIAAMMGVPASHGLFRSAVMMGLPLGFSARSVTDAARTSDRFLDVLGASSIDEARGRPPAQLVKAEQVLTAEASSWNLWCPGFCNVVDGVTLENQSIDALRANPRVDVDVLLGWTREEYAMSCFPEGEMLATTARRVIERLELPFGDEAVTAYDTYARLRPGALPVQVLIDVLSDERYRMSCLDLAELRSAAGRPAFTYQLDWQTRTMDGLLGAPHCLDIPFMLDNLDAWNDGLMLEGTDTPARAGLARTMHSACAAFAATGDPNHDGLTTWAPYTTDRRTVMRFDQISQPIDGLLDPWREMWRRLGGQQR
jgi:carboxylesterase type B